MNISVVIPTLNEEENIAECLSCLAGQLQNGDEVIVVDGGSDDETVAVASNLGARVLIHEGAGIGKARAIGTEKAENEIIASSDADARPPSGWLDRIRKNFTSDDDLVVLWGTIEDKNGMPIRDMVGKFSTRVGGASGNNTAFRKSAYEELKNGYPDIDFMEDFVIIGKLASVGKTRRDKKLKMVMDMDRKRYQTYPCLAASGAMAALSRKVGGDLGDAMLGASAGLAGTEMTYEEATGTPFHHDQIGMGVAQLGRQMGDNRVSGAGIGMIVHHFITEGPSISPTELYSNTDVEQ